MKQIIILRKDLNMRKGKMVAQGAHASLGICLEMQHQYLAFNNKDEVPWNPEIWNDWFQEWYMNRQTKICVSVDSEKELLDLQIAAETATLPHYLVKDAGLTEFKQPTWTALAIGPCPDELVDTLTKNLKLL